MRVDELGLGLGLTLVFTLVGRDASWWSVGAGALEFFNLEVPHH